MSEPEARGGISVQTMVIGVMLLITYLCWAMAASAYMGAAVEVAGPESGAGAGRLGARSRGLALIMASIISFLLNSVRLDQAPAILLNTLQHEQWIVLLFVVLMACALLFGAWVKKVEADLAGPRRRREGKQRKKRRVAD